LFCKWFPILITRFDLAVHRRFFAGARRHPSKSSLQILWHLFEDGPIETKRSYESEPSRSKEDEADVLFYNVKSKMTKRLNQSFPLTFLEMMDGGSDESNIKKLIANRRSMACLSAASFLLISS
jgi:hypothetical protein